MLSLLLASCPIVQAPLVTYAASYSYGAPLGMEVTPDGKRAFVATGASIAILDIGSVSLTQAPTLLDRFAVPDCSTHALRFHPGANGFDRRLFIAAGTQGLWQVPICRNVIVGTASCSSYAPLQVDTISNGFVSKLCIDVDLVPAPAMGPPLVVALFAARNVASLGAAQATTVRFYEILSAGGISAVQDFNFDSAAGFGPDAVGRSLVSDPGDPDSVYVALEQGGTYRLTIQRAAGSGPSGLVYGITAATLDVAGSPAVPADEHVEDLALVRTNTGAFLYAAADDQRLLEYDLSSVAPPLQIALPACSSPLVLGYPQRIAAVNIAGQGTFLLVTTAEKTGFEIRSRGPFTPTGIWRNHCVQSGTVHPNHVPIPIPMGSELCSVLVHIPTPGTAGFTSNCNSLTVGDANALGMREVPGATPSLLVYASSFGGGTRFAAGTTSSLRLSFLNGLVMEGMSAFDVVTSKVDSRNVIVGLDMMTGASLRGGLLHITDGASPAIDVVPDTQDSCSAATLAVNPSCPNRDPRPFMGGLVGTASWPDSTSSTREWFFRGAESLVPRTICSGGAPDFATPACGSGNPINWTEEPLSPSALTDKRCWRLFNMALGSAPPTRATLDNRWWQLVSPSNPSTVATPTTDYVFADAPDALQRLVVALRSGSNEGLLFFDRSVLELRPGPLSSTPGDGDTLQPDLGTSPLEFHRVPTHIELESPGPSSSPCSNTTNTLCPPGRRQLHAVRAETFAVLDEFDATHWVTAAAVGYVTTEDTQNTDCQWARKANRAEVVLYDITATEATFAAPTLLRVVLGPSFAASAPPIPNPAYPSLQMMGRPSNAWAIDTKTYKSGRTYAFIADLTGALYTVDVSWDRIGTPASTPYLPPGGAGTPILLPEAMLDFDLLLDQAQDDFGINCVDLEIEGDFAYCALARAGVAIVDISDPLAPTLVTVLETPGVAMGVHFRTDTLGNRQLVVADEICGVRLYR